MRVAVQKQFYVLYVADIFTSADTTNSIIIIFDYHGECYLKRMSDRLSLKWDRPYSVIMGWLSCRMQTCIFLSVSLCIRGSRKRCIWNNQEAEDGAAIPLVYEC